MALYPYFDGWPFLAGATTRFADMYSIGNGYVGGEFGQQTIYLDKDLGDTVQPGIMIMTLAMAYVGPQNDAWFYPSGVHWVKIDEEFASNDPLSSSGDTIPRMRHAVYYQRIFSPMSYDYFTEVFNANYSVATRSTVEDASVVCWLSHYDDYDSVCGTGGAVLDYSQVSQGWTEPVTVFPFDPEYPADLLVIDHALRWSSDYEDYIDYAQPNASIPADDPYSNRWLGVGGNAVTHHSQYTQSDTGISTNAFVKYYLDNFNQGSQYPTGTGLDGLGPWANPWEGYLVDWTAIGFILSSSSIPASKYRFSFDSMYQEVTWGVQPFMDLLTEVDPPFYWPGYAYSLAIDPAEWSFDSDMIPTGNVLFLRASVIWPGDEADVDLYWPGPNGFTSYSKSDKRIPPFEEEATPLHIIQGLGHVIWPDISPMRQFMVLTTFEVNQLTNWQFHYEIFFVPGADTVRNISSPSVERSDRTRWPATYVITGNGTAIEPDALIGLSLRSGYQSDVQET